MLCDEATPQLVDYVNADLPAALQAAVSEHLDGCAQCQIELTTVHEWQSQLNEWSAVWQEQIPSAWEAPQMAQGHSAKFWENLRMWFPMAASTAALAIVSIAFLQQPNTPVGTLPNGLASQVNYEALPPLPKATQAAMVQSVLDDSRDERGQELEALLKILKAEMDKRSIETEESLRYIISHQIQGQQELDELYNQVEALMSEDTAGVSALPTTREVSP